MTACECEEDGAITCDRVTGRCQCLPGVTGARCDRCLPRYILVANKGCQGQYTVHSELLVFTELLFCDGIYCR